LEPRPRGRAAGGAARPHAESISIELIGRLAAWLAAALAVTVLLGWLLDVDGLKSLAPGRATMKVNTAVAILLLVLATRLCRRSGGLRAIGFAAAGIAAVIALLSVIEHRTGVDLHIDQLLFHEAAGASETTSPGRMSSNTASGIILLALAIPLGTRARLRPAAEALVVAGGIVGLLGLVGQLSRTSSLTGFGSATHISVPAGIALLLVSLSLLLAGDGRLAGLLSAPGAGGALARRLLPAAVIVPLFVGGLVAWALSHQLIGARLEDWLLISAIIVAVGVLVVRTASSLERLDAERSGALAELHQANEQLRVLIDSSPLAIAVLDAEGAVRLWNQAAEDTFGWSKEEVIGNPYPVVEEGGRELFASDLRLTASGSPLAVARRRRRKDGSSLWVHSARAPLRDPAGEITGVIVVSVDISDRIEAEERVRQMNVELEQRVDERTRELTLANRELEAFSYSVSHDLRAPLRAIDGFGKALLEDYGEALDATAGDYVERMRAASQRMGQLIDDLLKLSRLSRSEMHRVRVDLSELARSIARELRESEPEREVEVVVQDGLEATGDPELLRIALTNLIGNGWKFTRDAEHARVEVGGRWQGDEHVFFVRDNGVGFDSAYVDRLFTPFQRLHSQHDFPGSGIGLATVSRVVRRHGGRVWADARPGQGAAFFFTLQRGKDGE
jgi:PAS domain S-box-containing protein